MPYIPENTQQGGHAVQVASLLMQNDIIFRWIHFCVAILALKFEIGEKICIFRIFHPLPTKKNGKKGKKWVDNDLREPVSDAIFLKETGQNQSKTTGKVPKFRRNLFPMTK